MNFDTYKINGELLEIYSDSDETFSVGKVLSKDSDSILFRSYDDQGKNDGLHYIKSSYINKVKSDTKYLRKIQLYLEYWEKRENVHLFNPFKVHPAISEVLLYAKSYSDIITIAVSSNPDELITGYIEACDNERVVVKCVDMETARIFENVTLQINDIFYMEIESIDNELLKYANDKLDI